MENDIGELKKSSRSVVRSVRAEDRELSTGERKFGKRLEEVPDVVGLGEGWITPGEGRGSVLEIVELGANQLLSGGKSWVTFIAAVVPGEVLLLSLMLDRLSCLRPPRFVATYSQVMPRFAQREHVGFSL
jgi:hypothetical protein